MALSREIQITGYSAWIRLSTNYRNLKLGYFWEVLSLYLVVTFLSLVWSRVLDSSSKLDYFFYVLTGFCVWGLMSRCIDQSLSFGNRLRVSMRNGGSTLKRETLTEVFGCLLHFLLTFPAVLVCCWFVYGFTFSGLFWVITSILCILVTAYALFSTLSLIAYFYEDISRFLRMVMRVAFLSTPILWYPSMIGESGHRLVYLNPFFTYLDVFRSAITNKAVSSDSVALMFLITISLFVIALKLSSIWEKKILRDLLVDRNA